MVGMTAVALVATLPILGWWGIPEDKATIERYIEARQAGFTVLMQGASSPEKTYELLERAQSAGIKLSVFFPEIGHDNMEEAIVKLKNHPALFMWHLSGFIRFRTVTAGSAD